MTVDPESAAGSFEYKGETYYFCSLHCLEKFRENPERFINKPVQPLMGQPVGIGRERIQHLSVTLSVPLPVLIRVSRSLPLPVLPRPSTLPHASGSAKGEALRLSKMRHGVGASDPAATQTKTEYTCPMHPQIIRDAPGSCPICGMTLEPRTVSLQQEENPELVNMTRRFWLSVALSLPVFLIGMNEFIPGYPLQRIAPMHVWILDPACAGHARSALGRLAFLRSRLAIHPKSQPEHVHTDWARRRRGLRLQRGGDMLPGGIPHSFRGHDGSVPVYFEAAAVITSLVLLGQVLELRAAAKQEQQSRLCWVWLRRPRSGFGKMARRKK